MTILKKQLECSICYETSTVTVQLKCKHELCKKCFTYHTSVCNKCPFCRRDIKNPNKVFEKSVVGLKKNFQNLINNAHLVNSLNIEMDDNARSEIKLLYQELTSKIVDLRLTTNDSPVMYSNYVNTLNIYTTSNDQLNYMQLVNNNDNYEEEEEISENDSSTDDDDSVNTSSNEDYSDLFSITMALFSE